MASFDPIELGFRRFSFQFLKLLETFFKFFEANCILHGFNLPKIKILKHTVNEILLHCLLFFYQWNWKCQKISNSDLLFLWTCLTHIFHTDFKNSWQNLKFLTMKLKNVNEILFFDSCQKIWKVYACVQLRMQLQLTT